MFLHYNQQIVSWSKVQKVCNLTDLVSVGISRSEDETLDVFLGEAVSFFLLSLVQDVSVVDKGCCTTCCSEMRVICELERHAILIR